MNKKQEPEQKAAMQSMEEQTSQKSPLVWCGPSVRGAARQYTVFAADSTPAGLKELLKKHPAAKGLLVPVEAFAETRKALETKGTAQSILYNKTREEL